MRVLVIPDVHLKPWMFDQAAKLLEQGMAEKAVCLMDIADDWNQQYNLDLYIQSYDAAIAFAKAFPETLWCYGNHDICYVWNQRETGYSKIAPWTVNEKLRILKETLPDESQLAFIHRIDNVLFMHGGLTEKFVKDYVPLKKQHSIDDTVKCVNSFGMAELWQDLSPLWYRPQYYKTRMYGEEKFLQIVGHTPVQRIEKCGNIVSCDVFSTDHDRKTIGRQEFLMIDTETWEYSGVR